jgi:hypothetical protein
MIERLRGLDYGCHGRTPERELACGNEIRDECPICAPALPGASVGGRIGCPEVILVVP